jgi:hypothetical protein
LTTKWKYVKIINEVNKKSLFMSEQFQPTQAQEVQILCNPNIHKNQTTQYKRVCEIAKSPIITPKPENNIFPVGISIVSTLAIVGLLKLWQRPTLEAPLPTVDECVLEYSTSNLSGRFIEQYVVEMELIDQIKLRAGIAKDIEYLKIEFEKMKNKRTWDSDCIRYTSGLKRFLHNNEVTKFGEFKNYYEGILNILDIKLEKLAKIEKAKLNEYLKASEVKSKIDELIKEYFEEWQKLDLTDLRSIKHMLESGEYEGRVKQKFAENGIDESFALSLCRFKLADIVAKIIARR